MTPTQRLYVLLIRLCRCSFLAASSLNPRLDADAPVNCLLVEPPLVPDQASLRASLEGSNRVALMGYLEEVRLACDEFLGPLMSRKRRR